MYKGIQGIEYNIIAREINSNRNTVGSLMGYVREIIAQHISLVSGPIGGLKPNGRPLIVEIDESLFTRRKYNRGRLGHNQWFIGGIERDSRNCFIVPVENRNSRTILSVLRDYVKPGSIIITDYWRRYDQLLGSLIMILTISSSTTL